MTGGEVEKIKQDILERYKKKTTGSKKHHELAKNWLPGGDTRAVAHYSPYPFFATEGKGCYIYDCDGNEYFDCVNNMTALIHGHAHPHIVEALRAQVEKGTAHAAPMEIQYKLAKTLCDRIPSVEAIRFCNSGTEATLFAMRAARYFTGKDKIIKMDGGYNGSHDYVEANILPDFGAEDLPNTLVAPGVPAGVANDILVAPFNDLDAMERILKANQDKIAAIIMEPVLAQSGGILPKEGYLKGIRDLADRYNVLLIFDEVITFRFHEGGFQTIYDVKPDLTALGKVIGGGLPVGAFGGRKEIMEAFDPTKHDMSKPEHSGTFSGNALTMTAGLATLEIYDQKEVDRINKLGERLRSGIKGALDDIGIKSQVGGFGSTAYAYFFEQPVNNAKEVVWGIFPTLDFSHFVHLELLNQGIYAIARGIIAFIVSTPMTEQEIDMIAKRFKEALKVVKPLAEELES